MKIDAGAKGGGGENGHGQEDEVRIYRQEDEVWLYRQEEKEVILVKQKELVNHRRPPEPSHINEPQESRIQSRWEKGKRCVKRKSWRLGPTCFCRLGSDQRK